MRKKMVKKSRNFAQPTLASRRVAKGGWFLRGGGWWKDLGLEEAGSSAGRERKEAVFPLVAIRTSKG
jgi:hypothetical protein